ncbi:MAG TPA: COX15/CtaA family protein [Gammaproteobacteria bacterium]|nr:COX15/CtaA family protein [Gammaproteobacteria bacterium]
MQKRHFLYIAIFAAVLAFGVVMLGAYVRLSQAGLGCPDWPGCYGHVTVPTVQQAAAADAARPLEAARAWKEMIHRYFAGTLTTLILILAVAAWVRRKEPGQPLLLPALLLALVVFQALLGMWTVTLLLFPPVVMGHLLGGFATFAVLVLLVMQTGGFFRLGAVATPTMRKLAALGLAVLICQVALGGWVSSNYAAIACPDFPTCQGSFWPPMDFASAFSWHGLGIDYQGGILANPARMAIHVVHRLGALTVFLLLGAAALLCLLKGRQPALRTLGLLVLVLLCLQVVLGISLVEFGWPLPLADLHNGVAALLLGATVTLNWAVWSGEGSA